MDRLDELAIFVRIVEEGSLVRAAARLRRSPPRVRFIGVTRTSSVVMRCER